MVDCRTCRSMRCEYNEIWKLNPYNKQPMYMIGEEFYYSCAKLFIGIHKFIRLCKYYTPMGKTLIQYMENKNMVNLTEIPTEKERVDLAKLPIEADLIAVSEEMVEKQTGKTGGLQIQYVMKSENDFTDMQFPQKYSAMSGKVLFDALNKLGINDTVELQKHLIRYKLTPMRTGFPRYIPVEILGDVETPVAPATPVKAKKR